MSRRVYIYIYIHFQTEKFVCAVGRCFHLPEPVSIYLNQFPFTWASFHLPEPVSIYMSQFPFTWASFHLHEPVSIYMSQFPFTWASFQFSNNVLLNFCVLQNRSMSIGLSVDWDCSSNFMWKNYVIVSSFQNSTGDSYVKTDMLLL